MRKEAPEVTQQNVFEFINKFMGRDLRKSETRGLYSLIKKYGPAEIQGRAQGIVSSIENEPTGAETISQHIEDIQILNGYKPQFGIHDLIRDEIEVEAAAQARTVS